MQHQIHYTGAMDIRCKFCGVLRFQREQLNCCDNGKDSLPPLQEYPANLRLLIDADGAECGFIEFSRMASNILIVAFYGTQLAVDALQGTTFQLFNLATESYYEGLCTPAAEEVQLQWGVSSRILCFLLCRQLSNCTFFTTAGAVCKLWTFTLDEGYHLGEFSPPLTPSYWPIVRSPPPPTDVALGKNATSGGVYWKFRTGYVLTYGSMCFPNTWDCMAAAIDSNWAKVDLGKTLPVSVIVLTGPADAARPYFVDITVRAGQYGDLSDPIVGKTPSATPAVNYKKVSFQVPATVSPFRYIHLKNENSVKEISLCKVQAFL
ncbi:Galactose-binding domain-like [Trinorchestia longiramus]|nr:Galactose-binding domain-like [Trinorchestia longiramus]